MVERTYTFVRRLHLSFWGAAGGILIALAFTPQSGEEEWSSSFTAFALIGIIFAQLIFVRPSFRRNVLKGRPDDIDKAISASKLAIKNRHAPSRSPNFRAIIDRDATFHTALEGEGWRYGDHTHAVYETTRRSEYKAATVYYSVLEVDLPRALPNMMFDSKKTHKKQFVPLFDRTQLHSLEGSFDQHFATFFPKNYSIDALSIITPEVMQAMIAANQFDFEIIGDKLYLYGPLVPAKQVPEMIKKGIAVHDKLMNNITTYRDERLEGEKGRQGVSAYGAQLRENPYAGWVLGIFGLGIFALGIYDRFATEHVTDDASDSIDAIISGLFLMLATAAFIWYRVRKNKLLDEKYVRRFEKEEPEATKAGA